MEKMKMQTEDITSRNISKIREMFPNCVTQARDETTGELRYAVDFDQLRQELCDHVVEGHQERYHLDWPGKRESTLLTNLPICKTLRPYRDESVNFDDTKNIFIEGDNFEALKIIEKSLMKSVKMIYIDPPYNTGRNLIYKNDYSESKADFLERSGQLDSDGNRLILNSDASGRFHSDWLSMMYSRLRVAKNVLSDEGVLVCAIDENEFGTLSIILKEIFSGASWEHTYVSVVHNPRRQQGDNFSYNNEYLIFVYPVGKKQKIICNREIPHDEVRWTQFRNWGSESKREDAKNCFYPVIVKDNKIVGFGDVCADDYNPKQTEKVGDAYHVYPVDKDGIERKWRYARQSVEKVANMLRADGSKDGYQIKIGKTFVQYRTVWTDTRYDANTHGTQLVNKLVKGAGFTYPKSLWAVYDPIKAVTGEDKDAIVLDFFAGSGTTAHAVMKLNSDDGGRRRFFCVQVPESIDPNSATHDEGFKTIADISKERIRKAGAEVLKESKENDPTLRLDVGFRVLKIDTSNMKDVYYRPDEFMQAELSGVIDNIKDGRTADDLLFQVLTEWGLDLALPFETSVVDGISITCVDGNSLVACFDGNLTKDFVTELARMKPERAVFRDSCYESDAMKVNVEQIFRQLSPSTEIRVL